MGCSLTLSVRHIVVALVLKVYPWMLRSFGLAHLFSAHGVVLISGICFVFFIVPETRGLTLTQLTTLFGGKLADDGITSAGIFFSRSPLFLLLSIYIKENSLLTKMHDFETIAVQIL